MTTLTNNYGLPQPLYDAVLNDDYEPGNAEYSITQLIDPPRKVALLRKHGADVVEDVSDRVWSLMGQAMHAILERAGIGLLEERLYTEVDGVRISGKYDYIDETGTLYDWKFTSVNEIVYGVRREREQQLNAYAFLAGRNNVQVNQLCIGFIFRDWSKRQARLEANYPPHQALLYPIRRWSSTETEQYLSGRIALHESARSSLPECTPEERWVRGSKYAVIKTGNKRATRLCDTEDEAYAVIRDKGLTHARVEHRPGESIRCADYCAALSFCSQGRALLL